MKEVYFKYECYIKRLNKLRFVSQVQNFLELVQRDTQITLSDVRRGSSPAFMGVAKDEERRRCKEMKRADEEDNQAVEEEISECNQPNNFTAASVDSRVEEEYDQPRRQLTCLQSPDLLLSGTTQGNRVLNNSDDDRYVSWTIQAKTGTV